MEFIAYRKTCTEKQHCDKQDRYLPSQIRAVAHRTPKDNKKHSILA
jgi:hypothetical protein